jgi:hypothetical protein
MDMGPPCFARPAQSTAAMWFLFPKKQIQLCLVP